MACMTPTFYFLSVRMPSSLHFKHSIHHGNTNYNTRVTTTSFDFLAKDPAMSVHSLISHRGHSLLIHLVQDEAFWGGVHMQVMLPKRL